MTKVLLFIESLRSGGKERRMVELLRSLSQDERFEFEVVLTRDEIHYEDFKTLGIRWHVIQRKGFKKDPRLFFLFLAIAFRFRPDIIHVWGHMPAVYAIPAKVLLGIPMINSEIADAQPEKRLLARRLVFWFSDRILANTRAGLLAYQAPDQKSGVIYNGFDFGRIKNLPATVSVRNAHRICTPYSIAMVATFSPNKDYTTFIRAALMILRQRKDVTFLAIGAGNDASYREMIPSSLQRYFVFPGKQSKVEEIMNACDIGILSTDTRVHSEGISNALLEFMALGKPVIATADGGTPELIHPNIDGFLIPPFDAVGLAGKIRLLLDQSALRSKMGISARENIRKQFDMGIMSTRFTEEYLRLSPVNQTSRHENIDVRTTTL